MKIKIEKECGNAREVLYDKEMTMWEAMDLAEIAVTDLAADDYFTTIYITTPQPDAAFSFSRTEHKILICLNGKPHGWLAFAL